MANYTFSNDIEVNPGQITTVVKDTGKELAQLNMSDGKSVTVPLSEYQLFQKWEKDELKERITKTDITRLITAMTRLAGMIPHSVRMHL